MSMKNLATVTLFATLFIALPFTSAIAVKNRLRGISGTVTQDPYGGDIMIIQHNKTGKCLDMDTDGGVHLRSCKNDTDEKWKLYTAGSSHRLQSLLNNRFLTVVNGAYGSTDNEDDATPIGRIIISTTNFLILKYFENNTNYALYGKKKGSGKYVLRVSTTLNHSDHYWKLYRQ